MKPGIVFPAFVNEFTGKEWLSVSLHNNNFNVFLEQGSELLDTDLTQFDFQKNTFHDDELKSQYISYIFNCCTGDIIKNHRIKPSFVSGYSMGIYSALYFSGSLDFLQGLIMVKRAWDVISEITTGRKFGMGMIIGLDDSDISKLLSNFNNIQICNQNNKHTFIISGEREAVEKLIYAAKEEGALRTSILPVSQPYHSHFLKNTEKAFAESVYRIPFRASCFRYVSAIDQKIIRTTPDLREEVIKNLYCRMNWYDTMRFMISNGTDSFFECGAGDGLTRNFRFIEGEYKSYSINRLENFLETSDL